MARSARWMPLAVAVAVAGMLTGAAAVADQAGCGDPASWVVTAEEAQLVGGCLDREDLPVLSPPARPGPAQPAPLGD